MRGRLLPYIWLSRALLPLALGRLAFKSLTHRAYRERWAERLGYAVPDAVEWWVHAVSLGEVRAVVPLVRALLERGHSVLVTTGTPTGSEEVRRQLGALVAHQYLPYDLPGAVDRFLQAARPQIAVFVETEIWPVLYDRLAARRIPVVLVNARLSERSRRRYTRFRCLFGRALAALTLVIAQSAADAQRFRALGVAAARVVVAGNLKFDAPPAQNPQAAHDLRQRLAGQRPVLVAASTHEGEEALLFEAFQSLRHTLPELVLMVAPRHPERAPKILRDPRAPGVCRRRTQGNEAPLGPDEWLLIDTLGELPLFLGAADVAFVGGSLVAHGGHNLLEACQAGVPCVFGPHTFNFADITRLVQAAGAGQRVQDLPTLTAALLRYLVDPQHRAEAGAQGRALLRDHAGALALTLTLLETVRPAPTQDRSI